MTRADNFMKNAKCKLGHRSPMSNLAWCDLNKNCTVLKLHDMCHNPKCNCQKQKLLLVNNFNKKVVQSKANFKSYLEERKLLGLISSNPLLMQQHRL